MSSERIDDIERIPRMSMEMLLLERQHAIQEWYADLLDKEISRRISMALMPLRKTA